MPGFGSAGDARIQHYNDSYSWVSFADAVSQALSHPHAKAVGYLFSVEGAVPCCVPAQVPSPDGTAMIDLGKVLGSCNALEQTASIAWEGQELRQDFRAAELLLVTLTALSGKPPMLIRLPSQQLPRWGIQIEYLDQANCAKLMQHVTCLADVLRSICGT